MSTTSVSSTPSASGGSGGGNSGESKFAPSQHTHLSNPNAAINVRSIMERAKDDLSKILSKMPGKKVLVLDEEIIGPLGHIAESKFLRDNDVEKIYRLTQKPFDCDYKNIMYIVRPKIHLMKWIATQIKHFNTSKVQQQQQTTIDKKGKKQPTPPATQANDDISGDKKFAVFLVPRITLICRRVLHELGVESDIILGEYALDLIPFDYDVLSMEIPASFKECNLDGDLSSLYYVARSIMKLQSFFGIIPHVKAKGKNANHILEMILRMKRQVGHEVLNSVPEIDTLILLDREVDLITPMLTQLTYEGLVDELFGIKHSFLQPTFPCVPGSQSNAPKPKIWLRSTDEIFQAIRDLNLSYVAPQLRMKAQDLDKEIQKRNELNQASIKDLREFAFKLPKLQEDKKNLEMHVNITQEINSHTGRLEFGKMIETQQDILLGENETKSLDFIEECINKQEPLTKVLRLLCLMSLTTNGIKTKMYDFFRKEILQTYGLEVLLTLNNLEKVGLLKRQESSKQWQQLKTKLGLINQDPGPKDLHSVHANYAPLSVQLIDKAHDPKGWKGIDGFDYMLPQMTREVTQKGVIGSLPERKVILLFFIGGVTFAELSAIRYLNERYAKQEDARVYLVATTKLINGNTFLESLYEDVGNVMKKTTEAVLKKKQLDMQQQMSMQQPPQ